MNGQTADNSGAGVITGLIVLAVTIVVFCIFMAVKTGKARRTIKHQKTKNVQPSKNRRSTTTGNFTAATITYIPDFPKYPNENTDTPASTYIHNTNGTVYRADGKPINDADATYLVRAGYKRAKTTELNSVNPKFHRTDKEKELEFQFFYKYGQQSQKMCDAFLNLMHQAYQTKNPEEKLSLLQQSVTVYNAAKDWHYCKSKGAKLWFQDNWEYCHNTKSTCFAWVDNIIKYIQDIQNEITNIRPWILEHASLGFLQTDVYKAFPDSDKSTLRDIIAQLADSGKIQKTKKGNTYFIQSDAKDGDI